MKPNLNKARIQACMKIQATFKDALVLVIRQTIDGTMGECVHPHGVREYMFVPLRVTGQHYRAMQVITLQYGRKEVLHAD